MLRDRLVCGMQDMKIQQKLLSETTLNLNNDFKISSAMERAQKDSLHIQNEPKEIMLNKVDYEKSLEKTKGGGKQSWVQQGKQACFRCGGSNHWENKCYFKNAECFKCKNIGKRYAHDLQKKVCPLKTLRLTKWRSAK